MKQWFKNLKPDMNDTFFFSGLIISGIGLWLYCPWLSLTAIGFVLLAVSLYRSR